MLLRIFSVLVFLFYLVCGQSRIDPLVDTDVGLIRGLRANDGDYSMFLGIPFGKVDENNPFGTSVPYPKFEDTFEAYDDSTICPQLEEFNYTLTGSIDCLKLNIFVPTTATTINRLPVLFWIYGGGYRRGFGNTYLYGPKFLVRHDVILVSINYRVGPYGFMCLDTPDIPGNQGLKDQLLALRWVQKNIEAFGGDLNKITVIGESVGGMSIDFHLMSQNEKLFSQAILQSGTSFSPFVYEPIKNAPVLLAEYLGYSTDKNEDALEFLSKVDTNLVVAAGYAMGIGNEFRPCIEKEFDSVERFISENWITSAVPKVSKMPILIGFNNNERYSYHAQNTNEFYQTNSVVDTQLANGFDSNSDDFAGMKEIVQHFYFGDKDISTHLKETIADFESDFLFMHPTYRTIKKYLENDSGNIYVYLFSYFGNRNYERRHLNITSSTGAMHADEIGYLFDISFMKSETITPEDQQIVDQITTMWTNFAKYGDPTPQTSDLLPVKWLPVTSKSELPFLNIDSQLTLGARPFYERSSFWDLFYKANEHLQIAYPSAKVEL